MTTTGDKLRLAFVSPVFLFPNNSGGRIRTTNILRGLKDGSFEVTLLCPASDEDLRAWATRVAVVCDRVVAWPPAHRRARWTRALDLLGALPVNVASDRTRPALQTVADTLSRNRFDVVVFDFVHSAVLVPQELNAPTVCFTHNVEAEIFARHAAQAANRLFRWVWAAQHAKMERFEREALRRFHGVIAVSERDAEHFRSRYGIAAPKTIPTGVDLDYFAWAVPPAPSTARPPTVVFIGSMDWMANVDGVRHFIDAVWPRVLAGEPQARFVVIGRNPPSSLVDLARSVPGVTFTGFVDDVRPFVAQAQASVIPLRIGGGTRIKAFEAMAMGCPLVSTSIGIEGLDVHDGEHYLRADDAADQAGAILRLLHDEELRVALARQARQCVEARFGHLVAARAFEEACLSVVARAQGGAAPGSAHRIIEIRNSTKTP